MTELWREEIHERERKEKLATYLFAMKEDLSEWIQSLLNISVSADTFMDVLDNGTHLCRLANMIQKAADKYLNENPESSLKLPEFIPTFKERGATHGSFVSRDNVANFIRWCRELGIPDVIIFESEDLVLHKFQKPVILTLLDVARRASKFDIEPPDLVIMEEQIDEEIALEQEAIALGKAALGQPDTVASVEQNIEHVQQNTNTVPVVVKPKSKKDTRKKIRNFIPKNLDTLVKEVVQQCACEDSFPVEKIADGKYKIGENRVLIFVRVMRNHVMVRVGGGWDTLDNYILKHDPCRAGGRTSGCYSGRQRARCQTPNHHSNHDHDSSVLHSTSNTSVASSDSGSSTSSVSRLSPVTNNHNALQSMVCVFGETGTEVVPSEQPSSSERLNPPVKAAEKRKNSTPSRITGGGKGLGSRHNSLVDVRDSVGCSGKGKCSTPGRTPTKAQALRATLQQADLTFSRARTSDAILRQRRDSLSTAVKRRGSKGNLSREPSSESLRVSRPKSAITRRKSFDERRKRSPDVRRRSAVSPVSARRRLETDYDGDLGTKVDTSAQKSALRKDLNDNNLMFSRSFSADTIMRGREARRLHGETISPPTTASLKYHGSPSRIPVPVTSYGRPRGCKKTLVDNGGPLEVNGGSSGLSNGGSLGTSNVGKCIHCIGVLCTCDEGFIDGDVTRSRPTSLCKENFDCKNRDGCCRNSKLLEVPHNGERFSGNAESLEWREVMSDILKYEENRTADR